MAAKTPASLRNYNFSDGTLEQLADYTAGNITRDLAALAERNITAATIASLEALRAVFCDMPTDIEARAIVTEASEEKEAKRGVLLHHARRLRTAALNTFGENTSAYNRFGFEGMDRLEDIKLPRACRRMHRIATALLADLAGEGIDAAFLTTFLTAIGNYDTALDNIDIAEESRDAQTADRIKKGNALYKEIVRLSHIGKDVFASISEALYNDYVIENFIGTGTIAATSLRVAGKVTSSATGLPIENATVEFIAEGKPPVVRLTNESGNYDFLFTKLAANEVVNALMKVGGVPKFTNQQRNISVTVGNSFTEDFVLVST